MTKYPRKGLTLSGELIPDAVQQSNNRSTGSEGDSFRTISGANYCVCPIMISAYYLHHSGAYR